MDDYELTQQEKWNDKKKDDQILNTLLPALMILFDTVEPLTFDCISTKEEIEQRDEDIYNQIRECRKIINSIDGKGPKFGIIKHNQPTKEELDKLKNDLSNMFWEMIKKEIKNEN